MSSKDGRQKRLDTREEQQAKAQMESAKCDMLVYKQIIFELKTVLKTKKDKKVKKALVMEIQANEDIIKTMIRSGVPDVPLPPEIELQIMVDKNKTDTQTGSKSPRTRSQAAMDKDDKKTEEGGGRQGKKTAKPSKSGEPAEDENEKAKNRSNRQQEKDTEQEEHETEGDKVKNHNKNKKGKANEGDEGGCGVRKERKGSDKASNREQASADTMDLFA